MKAPDKITIHKYNITDDGNVVFAWLSKSPDCEPMNHPVEYVRADTFIDKACAWLKENYKDYIIVDINNKYEGVDGLFIEDFTKYMKGD